MPITIRAKKEGITPQDVVDRYHSLIKESFKEFGISFDVYSRTTSPTHHQLASDFFKTLYNKGEFIEKHPNNITTRKQKHSLPTVISPENVLTAIRKALTATNAKSAEPHFLLQILSTRKAPSAAANR